MPSPGTYLLGDITPEEFLENYWQKKPCLIRQAIPDYRCPLTPDELAGLACEDDSEARLVLQDTSRADGWSVEYGPFTEETFRNLPATHWSLLVRHVDHYHPAINELMHTFSFIPYWRIDDVMISYATEHGSVGPHMDSYDVFLLQGLGQRKWQINRHDHSRENFIPGLDLRVLGNFKPEKEWVLLPGDILYLPPGVAHHGIALGDCMTLSIGFLAPRCSELVQHYIDDAFIDSDNDYRFSDADRKKQEHPAEITSDDLQRIRRMMQSCLSDEAAINHWFGRYVTGSAVEPEQPEVILSIETFLDRLSASGGLQRHGGIRTAYLRTNDKICLFMNGIVYTFNFDQLELVQSVTGQTRFYATDIRNHGQGPELGKFLLELYNHGFYYFDE